MLQYRHVALARAIWDPCRARFPRRSCYSDRTCPEMYRATVSSSSVSKCIPASRDPCHARFPRHNVLQCRHIAPARATRHPRIPIARASQGTPCYNDRTRPEAYDATVSTRNPRWWLTTSQDSNHTRNPSRARYSDRTRPETYVATVSARNPRWWLPTSQDSNHFRTCYSDHTRPEAYVAIVSPRNPRWWFPTSRDSNHTRTPSRTRYSDRTCPVAYVCYSVDTRYDGPSRAIFRALPIIAIRIQPYGSKALVEGYDGLTSFFGRNFSNPDIISVNVL